MNAQPIYRDAAKVAHGAGVRASNEAGLVAWIRQNCKYRADTEFFLVFGIGCELADMEARAEAYETAVERAYKLATRKLSEVPMVAG